jgi:hypothetical protein
VLRTFRNVAIIMLVALAITVLPGGDKAADTVLAALSMAFFAAIAWALFTLYRSRQLTLLSMTDGKRAILYGAVGAIALLIVGYEEFADLSGGVLLWIALMVAAVAAIFVAWRDAASNAY